MADSPSSPSLKAAITRTLLWVVATVVVASVGLREWAFRSEALAAERVLAEAVASALATPLQADLQGEPSDLDDACARLLTHPAVLAAWIFNDADQLVGSAVHPALDPQPFEDRRIEPGACRAMLISDADSQRSARGWLVDAPLARPASKSVSSGNNPRQSASQTHGGSAANGASNGGPVASGQKPAATAVAPSNSKFQPQPGHRQAAAGYGHLRLLLRPTLRPPPWYSRLWVTCAALLAIGAIGSAIGSRQLFDEILRPLARLGALALGDDKERRIGLDATHPGELHAIARAMETLRADRNEWRARAQLVTRTMNSRVAERTQLILRDLAKAKREMTTDPMTKLNNRRVLQDQFEAIFAAQREARQNLTLVMLDIDYFKTLNDTLGHRAGDELLTFTGELIRGSLRSNDVAVRYGGDEFVLILPAVGTAEGEAVARRLLALFAQHAMLLANLPQRPSLSAGVASLWEHAPRNAAELLEFADRALYAGKQAGRNQVCPFDPRMGPVRQGRSPLPLTRTAPAATVAPTAAPRA